MAKHSEVRPNESYMCKLVFDNVKGKYSISEYKFRVEWINSPEGDDRRLIHKMVAECLVTGEEFLKKFGDIPLQVYADAHPEIRIVYSRAE